MTQHELLNDLIQRAEKFIAQAEAYKQMPNELLNWRENDEKWSILQCVEHLNLYGDFYLPEFERRIIAAKKVKGDRPHKGGWYAERTANSMLPKAEKLTNKMNTFKNRNPNYSSVSITVLDRFIKQQQQMIHLMEQAKQVDVNRVKCNLTLPLLKFNLGSTFKFIAYHNERHFWQANNVAKAVKKG